MVRFLVIIAAVFGLCGVLYKVIPSSVQTAFNVGQYGITYMMLAGLAGAIVAYKATK